MVRHVRRHIIRLAAASLVQYTSEINSVVYEPNSIQKRTLKITIVGLANNYKQLRILFNLPSLFERRETLYKRFLKNLCLTHLVASNIAAKLRHANVYATPTVRTNRFRKTSILCSGQLLEYFAFVYIHCF